MRYILLALALCACHPTPGPTPPPPPDADATAPLPDASPPPPPPPAADAEAPSCTTACDRQQGLGCALAKDLARCKDACVANSNRPGLEWDVRCMSEATACGTCPIQPAP